MSTIAERVAAGAAYLDEREPGWWQRIDLERLNLGDCTLCVLGQLHGEFTSGQGWLVLGDQEVRGLGFERARSDMTDYADLTAEWRKVITERRAAS